MELIVGRVVRSHGVHGELVVEVRTDYPDDRFAVGTVLRARRPREQAGIEVTVSALRHHSGRLLVRVEGVQDRAAADAMRGMVFVVETADLPPAEDPDAFYDHELVGLTVVLGDDTVVGTVTDVLHGAANELLSVRPVQDRASEHLVPFVAAIVTSVDLAARRIVIDPPDGLLDI